MVWVLVDLPPGCKTVGSKWIFKKKTDMDGILYTYKARLVAKGYTQLYEIDYEETFPLVDDIRAIRILISITVLLIIIIPEKYASFKEPFMVLSEHQEAEIKDLMRKSKTLVLLKILMSHVYIKSLVGVLLHSSSWEATFILGIKIYRDRSKRLIGLGQNAYMNKILKRYKMDNSKRGHILMQKRLDLKKTQGASTPKEVKRMQNVPYASAVGSIMYATDRDDTKSQTGYVFILNGGSVDWKSSKQSTTAMSAAETEYIAASKAAMEAVWIRKFISGLGIVPTINEPIRMFYDNSSALYFANESRVQRGTRHYHRRYHYVRESIDLGEIRFLKVHTDDNLADPFTKDLFNTKLTQHARSMGLHLASSFM
nr:hypothetical protein [Tanacetum cinerariifolium]